MSTARDTDAARYSTERLPPLFNRKKHVTPHRLQLSLRRMRYKSWRSFLPGNMDCYYFPMDFKVIMVLFAWWASFNNNLNENIFNNVLLKETKIIISKEKRVYFRFFTIILYILLSLKSLYIRSHCSKHAPHIFPNWKAHVNSY